jgi:hypothetical protein
MSRPLLDSMEEAYPLAEPHLAVGSDGETAIAWAENSLHDPQDEESYFSQVWVAYRAAGQEWQDPYAVGQPHWDSTLIAEDVVVDGDGVAVVAVTGVRGISTARNSGAGWEEDGEVIRSGNSESDLGVGADGALDIAWHTGKRVPAEDGQVNFQYGVAAAYAPGGDDWSEPHQLGSNAKPALSAPVFTNPSLAEHSETATIVFASDTSPVQAVVRGSDGDYGAPVVIARPLRGGYYDHDVLGVWANQDGQALVLWGPAGLGQSGGWDLQASYRNGTEAPWSPSTSLSGGKPTTVDLLQRFPDAPAVVYPSGAAAVFWSDGQQILLRELGKPS